MSAWAWRLLRASALAASLVCTVALGGCAGSEVSERQAVARAVPNSSAAASLPSAPLADPGATAVASTRPPMFDANPRLLEAAQRGDVDGVRAALEAGAAVNARGADGGSAVLLATRGHHSEVVRVLIEAGADVNQQDARFDSAFLLAGAEGDVAVLQLAAPRADPALLNRFGGTALIPAAERGHVEAVRFLLEHTRVDVNHVNNLGWTALLEAIVLSNGGPQHQEIVRLLLAHGADANIADRGGVTPLRHARSRGYLEIARDLEAAGGR